MDKYLPELAERKKTVAEQISETRRIIYRTTLEARENRLRGANDQADADEFNIKNLKKKLDLLFEVFDELQNENSSSSTE